MIYHKDDGSDNSGLVSHRFHKFAPNYTAKFLYKSLTNENNLIRVNLSNPWQKNI